jgi:hypothetical protein
MTLETRTAALVVLDPTAEPLPQEAQLAPALDRLAGKRVGLLANGKRNSDRILEDLVGVLFGPDAEPEVVRRTKDNVSRPAAPEIIEELAANCDLVITAIGD